MEKTPNSPEKTDQANKATNDTVDKLKKDSDTKLRSKTPSPKPQKGSVKKVKPKPVKTKIKAEGLADSSKKVEKPMESRSRPGPLSRKLASSPDLQSPAKLNDSSSSTLESQNIIKPPPPKRQKLDMSGNQESLCDPFCWACHKEGSTLDCQVCPRSFHVKCDNQGQNPNELPPDPKNWICKECRAVILAEDTDTRSNAMAMLTIEQLCNLLKYALNRIKQQALKLLVDSQPDAFNKPVSVDEYPRYLDYIVHPIDLSLLEKNIKKRVYGSTEAFLADVKWLHHNSVIFNGGAHRLTTVAKGLVNTCKVEMKEIEICPDCYLHAHTLKDNWFLEPCRKAHVLVWAKLKGFPYWPGKVMQVENGNADIRFFGAHDRAWVPNHLCYLLSFDMPQPLKVKKKAAFDGSLDELEAHIQKLRVKLGGFDYAPIKTPLDPERIYLQPISKVSTGRRHSDADQSAFAKGRTVTIVTSSWMRRLQAEGFAKPKKDLKKSPKKTKKQTNSNTSSPQPSRMRMSDTKPSDSGVKKDIFLTKIKTENKQDDPDQAKNPPPLGVFEISDSSTLDNNKPLRLLSPSIVLNKVQTKTSCENVAEKLKQSFLTQCSSGSDVEIENEDNLPLINTINKSQSKSSDEPEKELVSDENSTNQKSSEPNESEAKESEVETNILKQCDISGTTSLTGIDKNIDLAELSSQLTPKKTNSLFVQKLEETIQSCKAKLGIEGTDEEIVVPSTESEGEEEETRDQTDTEMDHTGQEVCKTIETETITAKDCLPKSKPPESESTNQALSPPENDFSNISSDDGQNLIIDENMKDDDNEDTRLPNNEPETLGSEQMTSRSPTKNIPSDTTVRRSTGTKRTIDGTKVPSTPESASTSTSSPKPSEQTQKSAMSEIVASPASADNQVFNGNNLPVEGDPSNITNYAHKLIDFMQELCKDAGSPGNPQATIRSLELEIEKLRWRHQQELLEVKHNTDLILLEVRASMELDKRKCLAELREKFELEKQRIILELKLELEKEKQQAVENTKKKQWCANCGKEAIFYCCWNTSYCDYNCQQAHWMNHMNLCTQNQPTTQTSTGLMNTPTNIPILGSNKQVPVIPTSQLTRQRIVPQSTNPVISGPIQLQYVAGSQCYQIIPTTNIITPTINAPQIMRSMTPKQ